MFDSDSFWGDFLRGIILGMCIALILVDWLLFPVWEKQYCINAQIFTNLPTKYESQDCDILIDGMWVDLDNYLDYLKGIE